MVHRKPIVKVTKRTGIPGLRVQAVRLAAQPELSRRAVTSAVLLPVLKPVLLARKAAVVEPEVPHPVPMMQDLLQEVFLHRHITVETQEGASTAVVVEVEVQVEVAAVAVVQEVPAVQDNNSYPPEKNRIRQ